MRFLPLLLLLAACNGADEKPSGEQSTDLTGVSLQSIRVRVLAGSVKVETGAAARAVVTGPGVPAVVTEVLNGVLIVRDTSGGNDSSVDVVITVPAGEIDLDLSSRSARIEVAGRWGTIKARSMSGDVRIDVDGFAGGRLQTITGALAVVAAKDAPTEDLECRSDDGDVSVSVPSTFRGSIQATAASEKKLDVPGHEKLRMLEDSTRTNRRGWFGRAYTPEDKENAGAMWKDPPGIWARSKTGKASIRFSD